jgi:hypothetical protein
MEAVPWAVLSCRRVLDSVAPPYMRTKGSLDLYASLSVLSRAADMISVTSKQAAGARRYTGLRELCASHERDPHRTVAYPTR